DPDRAFQRLQHFLGAGRERVELALGEVGAYRRLRDDEVRRHQDEEERGDADRRVDQGFALFHRLRRTTLVAKSEKPITERKKSRSRESITPFWKPSKCVTTENAATVSTNPALAQRVNRSVTGLKPARMRKRHTTTERMNATT